MLVKWDPERPQPGDPHKYLVGTDRQTGEAFHLTDADLEKATPGDMAPFAPRIVDLLILLANHTLMHAGQFTVVRRKLGKPVLF